MPTTYTRRRKEQQKHDSWLSPISREKTPKPTWVTCTRVDVHWNNDRGYVYGVGLAAAQYVGDPAYLEFWKAMGQGMGWRDALGQVSDVDFDEFNRSFMEWLPSHIPQPMLVSVDVAWPGMGSPALTREEYLTFGIEWVPNWPFPTSRSSWSGDARLTNAFLGNPTGIGYVCLKWDGIGGDYNYAPEILGWYSNGELVSREDAELIEFTGESITLKDWSLPGHPNTLQPEAGQQCN